MYPTDVGVGYINGLMTTLQGHSTE